MLLHDSSDYLELSKIFFGLQSFDCFFEGTVLVSIFFFLKEKGKERRSALEMILGMPQCVCFFNIFMLMSLLFSLLDSFNACVYEIN